MKIAAGNNVRVFRKHEGVVGRTGAFNFQGVFHIGQGVTRRAVHLRHATETIGILNSRIIFTMRFANFALPNQRTQVFGNRNLPRMRSRLLNPQIERARRPHQTLEGHGAGNISHPREPFRTKKGEAADRVHRLGAIQ